jgi:hypothetical protein
MSPYKTTVAVPSGILTAKNMVFSARYRQPYQIHLELTRILFPKPILSGLIFWNAICPPWAVLFRPARLRSEPDLRLSDGAGYVGVGWPLETSEKP